MQVKKHFEDKRIIRHYKDLLVREEAYMRQIWHIAQFAILSDVSGSGQKLLSQFDLDRKKYQAAILEGSKKGGQVCGECKGICCHVAKREESHFHAADFWLRRYTDSPVPHQDSIQIEHPIKILRRSVVKTIAREISDPIGSMYYVVRAAKIIRKVIGIEKAEVKGARRNPISYNPVPGKRIPCMYLTEQGCSLDPRDRAITCIIHTCYAFREALTIESLKVVVENMKGLRMIHNELLLILKREGRLGRYSGWTRLATPVLPFGTPSIKHLSRVF